MLGAPQVARQDRLTWANLHNPEQQIVTNWKLLSAKIVSDCLATPHSPHWHSPFQWPFSSCHCYNQSGSWITRKTATAADSERMKEIRSEERYIRRDTKEQCVRDWMMAARTKKYRQVWRFMALFSAAHFAKKRFSTFTQLRHLCRVFRVAGTSQYYMYSTLCYTNSYRFTQWKWIKGKSVGKGERGVDTNLLTEAPVGPQCFLYGKRAESLSASLGAAAAFAAGKKL